MVAIPDGYEDLLQRPLYGHLATTRPNGTVQVNPMWFDWDGEVLRFTHTSKRQKYRNVTAHPQVAMSILDPDNPYRYLEVRGDVDADRARPGRHVLHAPQRPLRRTVHRAAARSPGSGRPRGAPDRLSTQ